MTHPDGHNGSKNTHVHIVFNSVRKYGGKQEKWHDKPCEWKQGCKHKSTGKMMHYAKKWVMDKCIRWGLEQVDLLAKKHSDNYWVEKRLMKSNSKNGIGATSNKEIIRNTIDKLLPSVDSFEQMVNYLTEIYHWKVRVTNKTITFTMPDMKQGIRGNRLGDGYGKDELTKCIHDMVTRKAKAAEEKARQERIARENAERIARIKAAKEAEEKRQKAVLDQKRQLAWDKNNTKNKYFSEMVNAEEWNVEYGNYLVAIDTRDYANMTIEELSEPILSRVEFEQIQKKELQKELSDKVQLIWTDVLNNVDGITHRWKYDYLDYLEELRFRDISALTIKELKQPILALDEYEQIKEEEYRREQANKVEEVLTDTKELYAEEKSDFTADAETSVELPDVISTTDTHIAEPVYVVTAEPEQIQSESVRDVDVVEVEATEPAREVEDMAEVDEEINITLTMEEKVEQIAEALSVLHIPYDDISAKKKAEIYQFTVTNVDYDLNLHSKVLKTLGLSRMYSSEIFDDYKEIIDATDKKKDMSENMYSIGRENVSQYTNKSSRR